MHVWQRVSAMRNASGRKRSYVLRLSPWRSIDTSAARNRGAEVSANSGEVDRFMVMLF